MSRPPPVMMLLSMPTVLPPTIAALSGMLKYSAMPRRCTGEVDESSHISRKNAIIAVMKSAYASFHAPPWWPLRLATMRLMKMGRSFSLLIAGLRSGSRERGASLRLHPAHVFFEFGERRALRGEQHLAAELHRDRRRVAVQARENRHLDALEHLRLLGDALLRDARERPDEAVRNENAEERADERLRDHLAKNGGRLIGGGHCVDDAHHRRDDAERGHRVADFLQRLRGRFAFHVMRLDLLVHEAFDLERVHVAADHEPQIV